MALKSLMRRFGIRHMMKVVADNRIYDADKMKSFYLTYKFNGRTNDGKNEIYNFEFHNEKFTIKRSLKNGVIYLLGTFGSFKADEIDRALLSALRRTAI